MAEAATGPEHDGSPEPEVVMLDARCPSRLLHGLPPGVLIRRLGLAQAVAETRAFLAEP